MNRDEGSIRRIIAGRLWTPNGFVDNRLLTIDEGRIESVEPLSGAVLPSNRDTLLDASAEIVIPGLVDLQVNGALGWSFQHRHRDHFDEILSFHLQRGTTTLLPTLVTAPGEELVASLGELAGYIRRGPQVGLPGIHLEGPFLSPEKRGAHDPDSLRLPDLDLADRLLEAADDTIRLLTLAPELPGSLDLIEELVRQTILVSVGHSAASYEEMQLALDAGLTLVTHAGNTTDWPHRARNAYGFMGSEPGVVGTLLSDTRLVGGLILDGFHVHPALLAPLLTVKGREGLYLVSDASPVAGSPPGQYSSGGLEVEVHAAGYATSGRGGGWLAGSTIALLDGVQRSVEQGQIALEDAVALASATPARILGLSSRLGHLGPGADADLLVLADDLSLRHVLRRGRPIEGHLA